MTSTPAQSVPAGRSVRGWTIVQAPNPPPVYAPEPSNSYGYIPGFGYGNISNSGYRYNYNYNYGYNYMNGHGYRHGCGTPGCSSGPYYYNPGGRSGGRRW